MTNKPKPKRAGKQSNRCKDCTWIHEADSVKKTSFMGVGLCQLHGAVIETLDACISARSELICLANDLRPSMNRLAIKRINRVIKELNLAIRSTGEDR